MIWWNNEVEALATNMGWHPVGLSSFMPDLASLAPNKTGNVRIEAVIVRAGITPGLLPGVGALSVLWPAGHRLSTVTCLHDGDRLPLLSSTG